MIHVFCENKLLLLLLLANISTIYALDSIHSMVLLDIKD